MNLICLYNFVAVIMLNALIYSKLYAGTEHGSSLHAAHMVINS